jgi:hypothetical protein
MELQYKPTQRKRETTAQNKNQYDRATSMICHKCRQPGHICKQCLLVLQSFIKPKQILTISSNNENNDKAYNLTNENIQDSNSSNLNIVGAISCMSIKEIVAKTMEEILVGNIKHRKNF